MFPDRPAEDIDGIWERALPGGRAPAHLLPTPEDLALHVAVHFGTDRVKPRRQRPRAAGRPRAHRGAVAGRLGRGDAPSGGDRARVRPPVPRPLLRAAAVRRGGPAELVTSLRPASFTPGARRPRSCVAGPGRGAVAPHRPGAGPRPAPPVPRSGGPERYVRFDEATPSVTRLRARRWVAMARRVATQLPRPLDLAQRRPPEPLDDAPSWASSPGRFSIRGPRRYPSNPMSTDPVRVAAALFTKPLLRGWLHLVCFFLAIPAAVLVIAGGRGRPGPLGRGGLRHRAGRPLRGQRELPPGPVVAGRPPPDAAARPRHDLRDDRRQLHAALPRWPSRAGWAR